MTYVPDIDDEFFNGILVIGDPHFRSKHLLEGEELVEQCVNLAKEIFPSLIVCLGDVLDSHEVARNAPYNLACKFVEQLAEVAPIYVLMGNHDLINQSQFCTPTHFFNPLKKWENVFIIDKPTVVMSGGKKFVMCPYVPPGRFLEMLSLLEDGDEELGIEEGQDWADADCIFAHQEFQGVNSSSRIEQGEELISEKGDIWDNEYPPVISGHIHCAQTVGENIFYPGSAMQINFDEDPDKKIWHVKFKSTLPSDEDGECNDEEDEQLTENISVVKYELDIKGKKEIIYPIEDVIDDKDGSITDEIIESATRYYIKLKLSGTPEQFKVFRKSKKYSLFTKSGIKVAFIPSSESNFMRGELLKRETTSFEGVLKEIVMSKTQNVQNAYNEIFNIE